MLPKPKAKRVWNGDVNLERCLAKTERHGDETTQGMSVYQHCRATGFVSEEIAGVFPWLNNAGVFSPGYDLIAALHDIGKVNPSFQKRIYNALTIAASAEELPLQDLEDYPDNVGALDHAEVSYASLVPLLGESIAYIEGCHHGWLRTRGKTSTAELYGGECWQVARKHLLELLENDFGSDIPASLSYSETQFLAGLTIVSDWISSSLYLREAESDLKSIIADKVREAGFVKHSFQNGLTFKEVFGFEERPEQKAFIESVKGPGIYVLESGMGTGKTEAALYAAYMLLSSGQADGLYFALPTKLTAKQIHYRVERFLERILEDRQPEAKLIFSNSFMYNCIYCNDFSTPSWFDSRKRMILAPFGVGTIDQALMSVMAVRHSAVRAFGLAGKVVIIDEVHSYDSYTGSLVNELIRLLSDLHATVIILSATLRQVAKAELLGLDRSSILSECYPCITYKRNNGDFGEENIKSKKSLSVDLKFIHVDAEAIDLAIEAGQEGRYVLWIENTVKEAQETYRIINSRCDGLNVRTALIHSRFLAKDRSDRERECLQAFGKDGWDRRQDYVGFILVGTQILEQSLDIDADVLFTRIAPADMIFQRIGRLWRHDHENRAGRPYCFVLSPRINDVYSNEYAFGSSGFIYYGYVLYRTLNALQDRKYLTCPDDIKSILELVYSDQAETSSTICSMKKMVMKKKELLKNMARMSMNRELDIMPDNEMSTRFSDLKYCRLLIISGYSVDFERIWLADGSCLDLGSAKRTIDRALVSLKLEENIISVPSSMCPHNASCVDCHSIVSKFVYVSDNEEDRLYILVLKGLVFEDLFGNPISGFRYSRKLGYYSVEEDFHA